MSGHFENGHFLSLAHTFARGMMAKLLTLPLRMTNPLRNGLTEVTTTKPLDLTQLLVEIWKFLVDILFLSCQSTLPWTYTTGAGSAAKDILDSDRDKFGSSKPCSLRGGRVSSLT